MTKQMHKFTALHILADGMSALEIQRQKRIDDGDDHAVTDRDTAQIALTGVVAFFLDQGIEATPLTRLLSELQTLSAGASPSGMLVPATTRHRRPDAPMFEMIKGRLAAIMEFQQRAGLTRKLAGQWVVRHVPPGMKSKLNLTSHETLSAWLKNWGGKRGAAQGFGRDGYLQMRELLNNRKPPEPQLKKVIETLGRSLSC